MGVDRTLNSSVARWIGVGLVGLYGIVWSLLGSGIHTYSRSRLVHPPPVPQVLCAITEPSPPPSVNPPFRRDLFQWEVVSPQPPPALSPPEAAVSVPEETDEVGRVWYLHGVFRLGGQWFSVWQVGEKIVLRRPGERLLGDLHIDTVEPLRVRVTGQGNARWVRVGERLLESETP